MGLLKAKFDDLVALGKEVARIAGYPRVTPEMFEQSYLFQGVTIDPANPDSFKANEAITVNIIEDSVKVEKTGMAALPGNPNSDAPKIPTYTVSYMTDDGVEHVLENRFAFVGLGSNSSPKVLAAKFGPQKFVDDNGVPHKDVTCPVIMAKLEDHAIVYSAFLGGAGSVPLTMAAQKGTTARISVAFYDAEQVKRINSSEPNYDVVTLNQPNITMNNGENMNVMPCVYESIWGPLMSPQGYMMTCDQIPHNPNRQQIITTMGAMKYAVSLLKDRGHIDKSTPFEQAVVDYKTPTATLFPDMPEMSLKKQKSYRVDMRVHQSCDLPFCQRSLDATIIQPATLSYKRERMLDMHIGGGRHKRTRSLRS